MDRNSESLTHNRPGLTSGSASASHGPNDINTGSQISDRHARVVHFESNAKISDKISELDSQGSFQDNAENTQNASDDNLITRDSAVQTPDSLYNKNKSPCDNEAQTPDSMYISQGPDAVDRVKSYAKEEKDREVERETGVQTPDFLYERTRVSLGQKSVSFQDTPHHVEEQQPKAGTDGYIEQESLSLKDTSRGKDLIHDKSFDSAEKPDYMYDKPRGIDPMDPHRQSHDLGLTKQKPDVEDKLRRKSHDDEETTSDVPSKRLRGNPGSITKSKPYPQSTQGKSEETDSQYSKDLARGPRYSQDSAKDASKIEKRKSRISETTYSIDSVQRPSLTDRQSAVGTGHRYSKESAEGITRTDRGRPSLTDDRKRSVGSGHRYSKESAKDIIRTDREQQFVTGHSTSTDLSQHPSEMEKKIDYPTIQQQTPELADYSEGSAWDDKKMHTTGSTPGLDLAQVFVEMTLALIKPEAMAHCREIENVILKQGFTIIQKARVLLSPEQASEFYFNNYGHPAFTNMVINISSAPVFAMLLARDKALSKWRTIIGPKDPIHAAKHYPHSLRAKYGVNLVQNAIHGSSSVSESLREIRFFFPHLIREPIPIKQIARDYLALNMNHVLSKGLTLLCKHKPADPITWLADWLLNNNPNKPHVDLVDPLLHTCSDCSGRHSGELH